MALHNAENLVRPNRSFWITRVPATVGGIQEFCDTDEPFEPCTDARYRYQRIETEYGGVRQQWVVHQSAERQAKQEKTFATVIEKELARARISQEKVTRPEYACEEDARRALERWGHEHPACSFVSSEIREIARKTTGTRGRSRAGKAMVSGYRIEVTIQPNHAWYARKRQKLGRFVLATNGLDLSPDRLLAQYKSQATVERRFRFLKDNAFRVSKIFLKKPSRIEVLAMIMTLSFYSLTEFRVRKALKERNGPSQVRKPTRNPTLKWLFFLFWGVQVLELAWDGRAPRTIHGLKEVMDQTLRLLGPACEKYYRLENYCGM